MKKLKDEKERKAAIKMGEPYSQHKEHICYHYEIGCGLCTKYDPFGKTKIRKVQTLKDPPWLITEFVYNRVVNPYISATSSGEYICQKCGHKFAEDEYQMLWSFLENNRYVEYDLPQGIKPVKYYYSAPNEIVEVPYMEENTKIKGTYKFSDILKTI